MSPFVAGIGLASATVSFVIGLYYNTMVSWTLLYLFAAVTRRPLPFGECPAEEGEATAAASSGRSQIPAERNSTGSTSNETVITQVDECQVGRCFVLAFSV